MAKGKKSKGCKGGEYRMTPTEKALSKKLKVQPADLKGLQSHFEAVKSGKSKWYIFEVTSGGVMCIGDLNDSARSWHYAIDSLLWTYGDTTRTTICKVIRRHLSRYIDRERARILREADRVAKELTRDSAIGEAVALLNRAAVGGRSK